MSFIREAGESLARLSGTILAKTEEFSRIAQISLEQKRLESALGNLERISGRYILGALNKGDAAPDLNDPTVARYLEQYRELLDAIETKKEEIVAVRYNYSRSGKPDSDSEE